MRSRLGFLAGLLLEHWPSYAGGGVAVGVTLWMTLAIPQYLETAVDGLRAGDRAALDGAVGWIIALAVTIIVTRTASRLLFFVPGRRVEYDLKNRLLAHLTTLQRDYFLRNPSGAIISRLNNDINGVRMLMGFGLLQLVNSVALLSLAPLQMYEISAELTLYVVPPLLIAFLLPQVALRRLRALQQQQMQTQQKLSDVTVESYNGLDTLRSYRASGWARRRFQGASDRLRDIGVRMALIRAFFMPILSHVVNALKVLLLLIAAPMVVRAELTLGELVAYLLYLSMLLAPLMGVTFMMFVLQRGMTSLGSLEQVLRTRSPRPAVGRDAAAALPPRLARGVEVRALSYRYPDAAAAPAALENINFTVRPGETVGLFGPIGCGKSTLVNLLNGYLIPPDGSVLLDGVDANHLQQQRLRRHVVTVSQEPFLFSATIGDNVRFGSPDADAGAAAAALEAAAMGTDLARFSSGLETLAGERGINLSGGQKQRIALARALLKPCDLLILDDVMSAVDHDTERFLIDRIYRLRHARALLIVSHRVSVLENADRIVVLDRGRQQAVGRHDELIGRAGVYRDAYLLQSENRERDGDAS